MSNKRFYDRPTLTYFLILLNIFSFIMSIFFLDATFLKNNVFSYQNFIVNGNFLSIIISGFLHSGLVHLFWNLLFLLLIGSIVEREFGKTLYLLIYLVGIILGNLFFMWFFPEAAAIGASGAVFGLMAAATLASPLKPIMRYIPIPVALVGVFYMVGEIANALTLADGIAHIAHIGGAFAGASVAMLTKRKESMKGIIIIIIILIILFFLGLLPI